VDIYFLSFFPWRLRGELTGSRWKVRYAARKAAIRPGGRTNCSAGPSGSPVPRRLNGGDSATELLRELC